MGRAVHDSFTNHAAAVLQFAITLITCLWAWILFVEVVQLKTLELTFKVRHGLAPSESVSRTDNTRRCLRSRNRGHPMFRGFSYRLLPYVVFWTTVSATLHVASLFASGSHALPAQILERARTQRAVVAVARPASHALLRTLPIPRRLPPADELRIRDIDHLARVLVLGQAVDEFANLVVCAHVISCFC